jgi:hypothetical protein
MPHRLGQATTMYTNSNRMAAMLAGLIFGPVQIIGYRYSYLIGAVLCAAGVALLVLIRPKPMQPPGSPATPSATGHRLSTPLPDS